MVTFNEMPVMSRIIWALVGYNVTERVERFLTRNSCFGIASDAISMLKQRVEAFAAAYRRSFNKVNSTLVDW